jgi:soluble lytic murein transglycosylase-like protein
MRFGFESIDNNYIPPPMDENKPRKSEKKDRSGHPEKKEKMQRALQAQDKRLKEVYESDWQMFKRMAKQAGKVFLAVTLTTGAGIKIGEYLDKKDKVAEPKKENYAKIDDSDSPSRQAAQELMTKYGVGLGAIDQDASAQVQSQQTSESHLPNNGKMIMGKKKLSDASNDRPANTNTWTSKPDTEVAKNQIEKKAEQQSKINVFDPIPYEQAGKIKIDKNFESSLYNAWLDYYQFNPKENKAYAKSVYELGEWDQVIKAVFKKKGLPEELRLIVIPESGGDLNAESNVGAKGLFQIMPKTGKDSNLPITNILDMRKDPESSSKVFCEIFRQNLKEFDGDTKLALAAYNGKPARKYFKPFAEANNKPVNFSGFLEYMSDQYAVNKRMIEKMRISEKSKRKIYQVKTADLTQNMNFAFKVLAAAQLGQGLRSDMQKPPLKFKESLVKDMGMKKLLKKVDKEKSLSQFACVHGIGLQELINLNTHLSSTKLKKGQLLNVPVRMSLSDIASVNKLDLKELHDYNPGVKDVKGALPGDLKVRLPLENNIKLYAKNDNRQK